MFLGNSIMLKISSVLVLVITIVTSATQTAAAVDYNAEIQKLQTQNSSNETNRSNLQTAASDLQTQIANLQAGIANLDKQIANNQTQQAELNQKIEANKAEIARQQAILADSIRKLYISNDMSTLEMVASSKNLSEYVDRQQYTLAAQSSVKQSMDRITALKSTQEKQKKQVDGLLADNTAMQSQMSEQKKQVSTLLAMNQSQQAQYSATIASNNSQITDLQKQQAEENERFLRAQAAAAAAAKAKAAANGTPVTQEAAPSGVRGVNGANYPYANAPWPNDIPDPWGMYKRQCVSYTAWAVTASGRHMPYWGGHGNAKEWDDNAIAAGIPVDSNPRPGDVAVKNSGTYGHVMYVNAVNSDGTISISQYNAAWTGTYSTATIYPSGLVFIHFP